MSGVVGGTGAWQLQPAGAAATVPLDLASSLALSLPSRGLALTFSFCRLEAVALPAWILPVFGSVLLCCLPRGFVVWLSFFSVHFAYAHSGSSSVTILSMLLSCGGSLMSSMHLFRLTVTAVI